MILETKKLYCCLCSDGPRGMLDPRGGPPDLRGPPPDQRGPPGPDFRDPRDHRGMPGDMRGPPDGRGTYNAACSLLENKAAVS